MPTNDGTSYFTLATERRVRRAQGLLSGPGPIEDYVKRTERGSGAPVLRDTTAKVTNFDSFGNVWAEQVSTRGVDLTWNVERTFENDTERWVLGQLETQKECSAAAGMSRCRTLSRTNTIYGEVETEAADSDEGIPDTKLHVTYSHDVFGNVEGVTAEDAFGHRRVSGTTYDPEGLFPETYVNAVEHTTTVEFDAELGVLTKLTDPNHLVTAWKHDGLNLRAICSKKEKRGGARGSGEARTPRCSRSWRTTGGWESVAIPSQRVTALAAEDPGRGHRTHSGRRHP